MSTDTLSTEFCLRLSRAWATLSRRLDSSLGSHHGISFADYQMLRHLARAPEGRLRRVDLAERLGLTASGVTRSLMPLEKIGLVGRQSDPRDARVGYAIITATGAELAATADTLVEQMAADMIGDPPFADFQALTDLLDRISSLNKR